MSALLDNAAITQRVERLEQRHRRWKIGALAFLLLVGAVLLTGQTRGSEPRTIEVERILLRDPAGKPRAVLEVVPDGSCRLALLDQNGTAHVALGVVADGSHAGLVLADRNGQACAFFETLPDSSTSLEFLDRNDQTRLTLGVSPTGEPILGFADPQGQVVGKRP